MLNELIYLCLGLSLGAYLSNSKIRDATNKTVISIFNKLGELLNKPNKQTTKKPVKSETKEKRKDKDELIQTEVKGTFPCTCGGVLEPIDGWKGYYACERCNSVKTVKTKG